MRYLLVLEFKNMTPQIFIYDDLETAKRRCIQLDGDRKTIYELPSITTLDDLVEVKL